MTYVQAQIHFTLQVILQEKSLVVQSGERGGYVYGYFERLRDLEIKH